MSFNVIPAQPGFFTLLQGEGGGLVKDEPIIAWVVRCVDDGDEEVYLLPSKAVTPSAVPVEYFIDPNGRVHNEKEECSYDSVDVANKYLKSRY